MATARDFITLAMKEAGVLGVGQTLLAEDINDGFTLLNRMLAQWQKKRWLVPNLYEVSNIGNNLKSNLIGPGQYYNSARPDKIQTAYFRQITSGSGSFSDGFNAGFDIGTNANNVSFPLIPIWSWEDYAKIQLKELNSWPQYFFYDGQFPYGNVYIWPIPSPQYEIHLVVKGPIGFNVELKNGVISDPGFGYIDGSYAAVPLINANAESFGAAALADVTVLNQVVTAVSIQNGGDGYKIGDVLSIDNTQLGNTGAGFLYTVTDTTSSLDAEFNMPPEYEEAIHYNLSTRLSAMYQMPVNPVSAALGKLALNTIKVANAQIPTLQMPAALRFRNNYNFYIFNADAR